jgi:hypothetical protein
MQAGLLNGEACGQLERQRTSGAPAGFFNTTNKGKILATKLYDLAVKTGEYTGNDGQTKGRWQNVGAVMQNNDGGKFIMLAKWFNPAGVPDLSGKNAQSESILLSMFPPKEQGQQQQAPAPRQAAPAPRPAPQHASMDDDIPF